MSDNVHRIYTTKQVERIVGLTYRRLDYWARTDLLKPSVAQAAGSGSRRAYSYRDLVQLRVVKDLADRGVSLSQIRKIFQNHRHLIGDAPGGGRLIISGGEVFYMSDDDDLIALLRRPGQQALALIMLEVEGIKQDLDGAIVAELGTAPTAAAPLARAAGA